MPFSNFHTHTFFCDGADSPEELVLEALRLGCQSIGFSGHSYVPFDDCCMSLSGTEEYKKNILGLKEKYRGRIKIFLGIEQDIFSPADTAGYDYIIGSVHYLFKNGEYVPVDESAAGLRRAVELHWGGDWYALAEDYYAAAAKLYDITKCNIVAHFDLITKFNQGGVFFDPSHPRYRTAALAALEALLKCPVAFEINTGAMARRFRREPYPEPFLLAALKNAGAPLVLSSDCHKRENLLFGFSAASKLLPSRK